MDVQTGLGMNVMVTQKGVDAYSVNELKRFMYELGRTYGILQHDKEPALKALLRKVTDELGGLSVRETPTDWKQAQGTVSQLQATLYGQLHVLLYILHLVFLQYHYCLLAQ